MKWKIVPCKACGASIHWVQENGYWIPYDFEGIGRKSLPHKETCKNPEYFQKDKPKSKRLEDPWWLD